MDSRAARILNVNGDDGATGNGDDGAMKDDEAMGNGDDGVIRNGMMGQWG